MLVIGGTLAGLAAAGVFGGSGGTGTTPTKGPETAKVVDKDAGSTASRDKDPDEGSTSSKDGSRTPEFKEVLP